MNKSLEENYVEVYLMDKYVDDINVATSLIPRGYSWEKEEKRWRLRWSAEKEESHKDRTAELANIIS